MRVRTAGTAAVLAASAALLAVPTAHAIATDAPRASQAAAFTYYWDPTGTFVVTIPG